MPKATIAGVRIHYEITGNGRPLVLTTGQGTGSASRAELIAGLATRFSVLSYDQRGTGRSERVTEGQSIEDLAEDIVALMDAAGLTNADVVGLSTGTGKATALAAYHPDRVKRLVLAAPWTHGDAYLRVIQNMRKAAARTMPADHYTQFNALLIYPPEFRREHASRFATLAEDALQSPPNADGLAARLDSILAFNALPLYPRITCPTLVVGARDDQVMPIWFAEQAAEAISGSRKVILDGGGHMFPETRTVDFLRIVLDFLN